VVFQCCLSTVCNDLLVAFEQAWSEVNIFERGLSRVCDDIFIDFGDVVSKRVGWQCLLNTVSDKLILAFEQAVLNVV